jgi:hypothetical protein
MFATLENTDIKSSPEPFVLEKYPWRAALEREGATGIELAALQLTLRGGFHFWAEGGLLCDLSCCASRAVEHGWDLERVGGLLRLIAPGRPTLTRRA